ncbi:polysaccharide lyase [Pleionea sediminis]|uniref:polysaccharide lyase n=1 Tax=Pleionea sediminis TaxID=2569479 RepID=UPI001184C204|nr:hypothetical protein [Pleionea sediminis]
MINRYCLLLILGASANSVLGDESFCPQGSSPNPAVLFCDSFETQGNSELQIDASRYYDFDNDEGDFIRSTEESAHGNYSARVLWQPGEQSAGAMHVNFGRSPLNSTIQSDQNFSEIYWRFYVKLPNDFEGYPDKLSRITIMANSNWAQAMIGHVWANSSRRDHLQIDPVSGIKNDQLVTTKYNDFANFTWLGALDADTTFQKGDWVCVESRVKLNDSGLTNGEFELFINGDSSASKTNINWVGNWDSYGLNAIMLSNYWNGDGSPREQTRYIDALVISTQRIGCLSEVRPNPPSDVTVQ